MTKQESTLFDCQANYSSDMNICPYTEEPCEFWINTSDGGDCIVIEKQYCPIEKNVERHIGAKRKRSFTS